jgi:hypothetical protein
LHPLFPSRETPLLPQGLRWLIVHEITYPFAFTALCCSKLLVLSRLMDFSKLTHVGRASRWLYAGRVLVAVIVCGNLVGLGCNVAASVFFFRAADVRQSMASYVNISDPRERVQFLELQAKANNAMNSGAQLAAVHAGCETILLLLIVIAVSVVGAACVHRIRATMRALSHTRKSILLPSAAQTADPAARRPFNANDDPLSSAARHLKLQIGGTCAVIFVSFVIRAFYATMFTLATALASNANDCPAGIWKNRCTDCYNIWYYVLLWLLYTPGLYFCVALVALPLALLVALWGMTSGHLLRRLRR